MRSYAIIYAMLLAHFVALNAATSCFYAIYVPTFEAIEFHIISYCNMIVHNLQHTRLKTPMLLPPCSALLLTPSGAAYARVCGVLNILALCCIDPATTISLA